MRGQRGDGARAAGRRVHPATDRQRVADGFAGVDIQAGRRRCGGAAHTRAAVRRRPSRRRATRPTPAGPASRPAPARRERPTSPAAGGPGSRWCCRRHRRRPRRPTAAGGGASGSGSGARCRPTTPARRPGRPRGVGVSTTSSVRPNRSVATMLVVRAPMWMPRVRNGSWFTSTGTRGRPMAPRDGEVCAFAQHTGLEQGGDLTVHRGDAQPGGVRDDVSGDRPAHPRGTENRGGRGFGDAQRGRDDVVPGKHARLACCGAGSDGGGGVWCARGCPLVKSAGGCVPHLATQQDSGSCPGSVRRGEMRDNNTHAGGASA